MGVSFAKWVDGIDFTLFFCEVGECLVFGRYSRDVERGIFILRVICRGSWERGGGGG